MSVYCDRVRVSLICNFYLSVAAHIIISADPLLRYTSMLLGSQATNQQFSNSNKQTTHLKDTTKEEIYARIRAARSCFGKNKEILQDKQLPISLKKQVMDQCILPTMTYGCQTWSLNKQMTNKLRTAQRAMERKMLDLKLKDKIPCAEIRKRTKIIDIIEYTLKQKWKWAGHIARLKDNRWTRRCTEWQPRRGKRSRGRPSRRWQDDITEKEGTTWIRKATDRRRWKTLMEGYILQWMDKA